MGFLEKLVVKLNEWNEKINSKTIDIILKREEKYLNVPSEVIVDKQSTLDQHEEEV